MKNLCLITGASRGLGKELAKEMASKGNDLCLVARNEKNLLEVKKEITKLYGVEVLTFCGDISNESFLKNMFNNLKENYNIEYLINNAGVGKFGRAQDNNKKMIDEVLNSCLVGTILTTSLALPLMKEYGTIVTLLSTAGLQGNANESVYCASKWGARGFIEALRKELSNTKIKLINIFPGGINTTFWQDNRDYVSIEKSDTFMNARELAKVIVENISKKQSLVVKELIIERLK